MLQSPSRRKFLTHLGGAAAISLASYGDGQASFFAAPNSRFKLSVITDEISQDLGHALEIATKEFGMGFVELRSLWNKNIINLDQKEIAEAQGLLQKYSVQVTDSATPPCTADWLGSLTSK